MRQEFREIVQGWTSIDSLDDLTARIERAAIWTQKNKPLEPDEQAAIQLMVEAQITKGFLDSWM